MALSWLRVYWTHTPLYIVRAEAVIGLGLAALGYATLRVCVPRAAAWLGATAGLGTILGGTVSWGLVEFIGQGTAPTWPFP